MTFHPDFQTNGKFYVNVTIDNGGQVFQNAVSPFSTQIREYTVSANPNVANTNFNPILSFLQPQSNHNAGWIGFNPPVPAGRPQYLYIPTGDGGGGNDDGDGHTPGTGNAQSITNNFLGKILRVNVNGDDFPSDPNRNYRIPSDNPFVGVTGDDEIWAVGMRNPFRDSFDRTTGDLWLGDVGQSTAKKSIVKLPMPSEATTLGGGSARETCKRPRSAGQCRPTMWRPCTITAARALSAARPSLAATCIAAPIRNFKECISSPIRAISATPPQTSFGCSIPPIQPAP